MVNSDNQMILLLSCIVGVCYTNSILSFPVAEIGANIVDPPASGGRVTECANEEVGVRLGFRTNVRKGPNRSCRIQYQTADNNATGKRSAVLITWCMIAVEQQL